MDVSVIIPAHNAADTIGEQLAALSAQEASSVAWELIVVDNNSTDATIDIAESYASRIPGLRVISATGRAGSGYARDQGAAAASGKVLAFCDADDIVSPGWVANMGKAVADNEFVAGALELEDLNPAWAVRSRGRTDGDSVPLYEGMFPMASGCNMGIDSRLFEDLGGFDNDYDRVEDAELSMRAWMAGHPASFAPDAVIHYRLRADIRTMFRQSRGYGLHRPRLIRRAVEFGAPKPPLGPRLKSWAWLALATVKLRDRATRAHWAWVLGLKIGTLQGAARARRIHL